jgi:hypothetical protein
MDVDASLTRNVEDPGRQDETVGSDDHDVRAHSAQPVDDRGVTQRQRLLDRQTVFDGELLDRRRDVLQPAARRPVGLSEH